MTTTRKQLPPYLNIRLLSALAIGSYCCLFSWFVLKFPISGEVLSGEACNNKENPAVLRSRARSKPNTDIREKEQISDHNHSNGEIDDDVYPLLLAEARRRSALDFKTSHAYGERGVAIGPVGGNFRHTLIALQNARRIRNILGQESPIKVAVVTTKEHITLIKNSCQGKIADSHPDIELPPGPDNNFATPNELLETCRLWANGTLLDHLIETWPNPPYTNESHVRDKAPDGGYTSRFQMTAMGGAFRAPYRRTLILDSDAYPCPGFEKLFDVLRPFTKKLWSYPSFAAVDLAIGLEQFAQPIGDWSVPSKYNPGGGKWFSDFPFFSERNTGVHLWNFEREHTHVFAHFLVLVAEHVYNNVATETNGVVHDQIPFRIALYIYRRLVPEFHEENFPQHISCRTFPNRPFTNLDGARNGMFPVQPDGKICSDCQCTPCLITHCGNTLYVTVNGKMGWEDNNRIVGGASSLP